ncbi:MAG TPA: GNAT family N-acetyltransferase [Caulobacteraceae bacterium]|jgi:putative acetyltransferase|nr:GNAT family N-acetyltransferase [Caulobacteraceae bacterium]
MSVTIRPYTSSDAASVAAVFFNAVRDIGPLGYTPDQVAAWAPEVSAPSGFDARANDGRTTFVAVNPSGDVVGYADLELNGHLDHLYCRPDAAGCGIGGALVDALLARASAQGLNRVYAEASEIARPLFERKGFRCVERREFVLRGVPIHNYAMEWTPPPAVAKARGK